MMSSALANAFGEGLTRPENLTGRVYAAIRDAIINRRLEPGTRISEARLAQQLNVSKTPVREAMLRLMQIGLLESDGQRGALVPEPSVARTRAAYELREGLEAQSARLAAQAHTVDELVAIRHTAQQCFDHAAAGDSTAFRLHDRAFHAALADATHNALVSEHLLASYDLTLVLRLRDAPAEGFMTNCARQHLVLVDAVGRRDSAAADALMREHIRTVADKVLTAMPPPQA